MYLKLILASNIPVNGPAFPSQGVIQLFIQLSGQMLRAVHVTFLIPTPVISNQSPTVRCLFNPSFHLHYRLMCMNATTFLLFSLASILSLSNLSAHERMVNLYQRWPQTVSINENSSIFSTLIGYISNYLHWPTRPFRIWPQPTFLALFFHSSPPCLLLEPFSVHLVSLLFSHLWDFMYSVPTAIITYSITATMKMKWCYF